jgi:hypothetical protein
LIEFEWNFQILMEFERETHVCTWMTDQLMKISLEFQIGEFIDLLQEFDLNFYFGYLKLDYSMELILD